MSRRRADAPANDDALGAEAEAIIDDVLAASVPLLRAHLRRAMASRLAYLRPRPRRERLPAAPDEGAVDDLTRAKARALLDRVKRGRRG